MLLAWALASLLTIGCLLPVQFEDSEEDLDSRFDTDDELCYRRDSVYSCVTLPYFHSFLFMKGTARGHPGTWACGGDGGRRPTSRGLL